MNGTEQTPLNATENAVPKSINGINQAIPPKLPTYEIHATGLNAHNQLPRCPDAKDHTSTQGKDLHTPFLQIKHHSQQPIQVLSTWSSTHFILDDHLHSSGTGYETTTTTAIPTTPEPKTTATPSPAPIPIGDHNGLLALLSPTGTLHLSTPHCPTPSAPRTHLPAFHPSRNPSPPPLQSLALATNNTLALTFRQSPNAGLSHITTFSTFPAFRAWYEDPANPDYKPEAHFMLPGHVVKLAAGAGVFLALMDDGGVYSWGDARYLSLGRGIGDGVSAERPGVVEALGGLRIVDVGVGGWVCGGLSEDGVLYLWGLGVMPGGGRGGGRGIRCLREAGEEEVVVAEIFAKEGGEVLDVVGFGVGEGFVVVVTEGGGVWGVGENGNGQLGLGEGGEAFVEDWTQMQGVPEGVVGVTCGPKATFLHCKREGQGHVAIL